MIQEFKDFISEGNIVEVAVAFIMGLAIKTVIDALVGSIIMPIIAVIIGKPSFSDLTLTIHKGIISYGVFITAAVNFLIVAVVLFFMLKMYNKMVAMKGTKPGEDEGPDEVQLLVEIRDALRARP